ncbi:hypothetical protein [Robertkochia solimangrovi]|uniref:hypothetical protein n=1 Tax=Robertkochia solimangrovi TaxID=2213046 RepID=UPI00117EFCE7|nr:hypothetical protein [Robertkochia solimangrovi]TRZ41646.1 hypothetical protein DMZ48_16695 [Robertkochia solimangrovi]
MNKYLIIFFILISISGCNKKNKEIDENCFAILKIEKENFFIEIKEANYSSTFNILRLRNELNKSKDFYYSLKPKLNHQYLIKYKKDIDPHYLKKIKSIILSFYKDNIDKNEISVKVYNTSYDEINIEKRENINKFFPAIIYSPIR